MLGRYDNGIGKKWDDPDYMTFYNDGAFELPLPVGRHWFLTHHRRWGLLKSDPRLPGRGQADQPHRTSYKEAASALKISLPKSDFRTSKLIDGTVWDGKDPKKYAASFKIHA